jgi:hypothetical protein
MPHGFAARMEAAVPEFAASVAAIDRSVLSPAASG